MTSQFDKVCKSLINKLNATSLEDLCDELPNCSNSIVHVFNGKKSLKDGDLISAFNNFSHSHYSLMAHCLDNKLIRPSRHTDKTDETELKDHHKNDKNHMNSIMKEVLQTKKDEMFELLKELPPDWTVIHITCDMPDSGPAYLRPPDHPLELPRVYISRAECGPSPSLCIKDIEPYSTEGGVRSILQEINLITEENKVLNKKYGDNPTKFTERREELSNRLKALVRSMETAWLRSWVSLLCGTLPPREQLLLKEITDELVTSLSLQLSDNQIQLLQLLMSYPVPPVTCNHLEKWTIKFPLAAGVASILGLSVRTKKVKDIVAFFKEKETILEKLKVTTRNPTILIIDKMLVSLPWEMVRVMREQPVTRVPNLRTLVMLYKLHSHSSESVLVNGIVSRKGFYLLDPDNILPNSQKRLKDFLEATEMSGLTAERPSHEQFQTALSTNDMFIYIGHGSGSQYLPGELVEQTKCRTLTLLYGCASVCLARSGRLPDPWGVVLNYLIASCPCIVGMLWEVTDKDTDILTKEMLSTFLGMRSNSLSPDTDVAMVTSQARSLCTWYINAAALAVYGLPLHFDSSS